MFDNIEWHSFYNLAGIIIHVGYAHDNDIRYSINFDTLRTSISYNVF